MSGTDLCSRVISGLLTLADGAALPPYRPFIDPLEVHGWWWAMLLPMAIGIAVVYKAVRVKGPEMRGYWLGVVRMTVEIVLGMVLLAAATYFLVEVCVKRMSGG